MKIGNLEINFRGGKKKGQADEAAEEERSLFNAYGLTFGGVSSYRSAHAMQLSAVYAATNQISNSCAVLPVNIIRKKNGNREVYDHKATALLNSRPNAFMNHYDLVKMVIESVILNGEAFVYITRNPDTLEVTSLDYLDPTNVDVMVTGDSIKYLVTGMDRAVDGVNMLHFWQHLDVNTHRGISVLSYAARSLKNANDGEQHSSNFFRSGANLSGVLKSTAPLNARQKEEIRESWAAAFGNTNSNVGVAVLPQGLEYQPISVNPADSQLLESRQYDIIEIARFFNISPVKLFDLTHSSYRTAEQVQLSYVSDTVYPYVKMLKEELDRKLFKPSEVGRYEVEFDFTELLATDKESLAGYYKTLLTNGIMSLNEVREKLDLPRVENGDEHYLQLNMTTLTNIVEGANIKSNLLDNQYKQNPDKEEKPEEKEEEK